MNTWLSRAVLVAIALLPAGTRLAAHPGAASDVVISIGPGSVCHVQFTTLPESLALKLRTLSAGADRAAGPEESITELRQTLLDHMDLRFDHEPVALSWVGIAAPEAAADRATGKIVVHLSARVPPGAEHLSWRSTLILGSYPLVVRDGSSDGPEESVEWLQGPEWSRRHTLGEAASSSTWSTFIAGLGLGFAHIVPRGIDHMLFVLGIFLLTTRVRAVLLQISLFTVAHSITLGLAMHGLVSLPERIVEPLIALSIVYIAFENLRTSELARGRLALIFLFGLLHGLGFAETLGALGLPASQFVTTLVAFNVGVEGGQLAVIGVAAIGASALALPPVTYRRIVVRPASSAIAIIGALWTIERLLP